MVNQRGFTVVEIICVLTILGIIAIFAIPKIIQVDKRAEIQALDMGVNELNNREKFVWTQQKLAVAGFSDEELNNQIKELVDLDVGNKYNWSGQTLIFGSAMVQLERIPAKNIHPAIWGGVDSKGNKYGWYKNSQNPHYTE